MKIAIDAATKARIDAALARGAERNRLNPPPVEPPRVKSQEEIDDDARHIDFIEWSEGPLVVPEPEPEPEPKNDGS